MSDMTYGSRTHAGERVVGAKQVGSVAAVVAVLVAGAIQIGVDGWVENGSATGEAVTVVSGAARGRADAAFVPVTVVPAPVPPVAAKPVPSRDGVRLTARRDMALVQELAGKGPPEQALLGDVMMTQERDATQAAPVEAAMQAAFAGVHALAGGPARVTCVRTTCEVTGVAASGQPPAAVEQALRDPALLRAMVARGYMPGPVTVAAVAGGATKFVMYLNNEM